MSTMPTVPSPMKPEVLLPLPVQMLEKAPPSESPQLLLAL